MRTFVALPAVGLEAALAAVERAAGVTITVRDLHGTFAALGVEARRGSHRRQAVCDRGFAPACIAHCRHAANVACAQTAEAMRHTCWKSVCEVVVPVQRDGVLFGYLFAGAWRSGRSVPGPWQAAWRALPRWDARRAAQVAALLLPLAAALAHQPPASPPGRAGRIRAWLRAHLAQPGLRAGLARHLGLSASRTSHVVRRELGCSLETAVAEERLAAACALLRDGDLAVAEVGERVGWADPPHFTRMFRRLAGCSPGRWRVRQRGA